MAAPTAPPTTAPTGPPTQAPTAAPAQPAAETASAVAARATRKGCSYQPASSSEPYFASHSACSLRRQRRSSCHSGYIHPGNRTGTKPNTATTNDTKHPIKNNSERKLSSPPVASVSRPHPPNSMKPPTAGSITAMVLRPRLKDSDSISRARSPQSLSENIANHQATIANNPIKIPVKLYTTLIQAPKKSRHEHQWKRPWVFVLTQPANAFPAPDPMAAPTAPPTTAPTGPPATSSRASPCRHHRATLCG